MEALHGFESRAGDLTAQRHGRHHMTTEKTTTAPLPDLTITIPGELRHAVAVAITRLTPRTYDDAGGMPSPHRMRLAADLLDPDATGHAGGLPEPSDTIKCGRAKFSGSHRNVQSKLGADFQVGVHNRDSACPTVIVQVDSGKDWILSRAAARQLAANLTASAREAEARDA